MKGDLQFSSEELAIFLRLSGWTKVDDGPQGATFESSNSDLPAILVPDSARSTADEVRSMMDSAVQKLSMASGKAAEEIVGEIQGIVGIVEVRVSDAETHSGRIPVERGLQLVEFIREVVYNGARSHALGGRARYTGKNASEVQTLIDRFRLVPPARGSFKLRVIATPDPQGSIPVPGEDSYADLKGAIQSAVTAVKVVGEIAGREQIPDDIDDLEGEIRLGLSTNLLESIRSVGQSGSREVEVSTRILSGELDPIEPVTLNWQQMERMPRILSVLKQSAPRKNMMVSGWVKSVEADDLVKEGENPSGRVVVEARIEKRLREVSIEVAGEEFAVARRAVGEQSLSAVGTLDKIGNRWLLKEPRNLSIASKARK